MTETDKIISDLHDERNAAKDEAHRLEVENHRLKLKVEQLEKINAQLLDEVNTTEQLREQLGFLLEWAEGIMWDRLDFTKEEIASRFPSVRAILE